MKHSDTGFQAQTVVDHVAATIDTVRERVDQHETAHRNLFVAYFDLKAAKSASIDGGTSMPDSEAAAGDVAATTFEPVEDFSTDNTPDNDEFKRQIEAMAPFVHVCSIFLEKNDREVAAMVDDATVDSFTETLDSIESWIKQVKCWLETLEAGRWRLYVALARHSLAESGEGGAA